MIFEAPDTDTHPTREISRLAAIPFTYGPALAAPDRFVERFGGGGV
jgi:hypothetical protein